MPLKGDVGFVASPQRLDRSPVNTNLKEFSPRIGLAYMLTPSTVVRAGYGTFWLPIDVNLFASPDHDSINAITESMNTSLDGGHNALQCAFESVSGGHYPCAATKCRSQSGSVWTNGADAGSEQQARIYAAMELRYSEAVRPQLPDRRRLCWRQGNAPTDSDPGRESPAKSIYPAAGRARRGDHVSWNGGQSLCGLRACELSLRGPNNCLRAVAAAFRRLMVKCNTPRREMAIPAINRSS